MEEKLLRGRLRTRWIDQIREETEIRGKKLGISIRKSKRKDATGDFSVIIDLSLETI